MLVGAANIPPLGNRGFGGGAVRDGNFTLISGRPESTYFADANRETLNIARIETPDAVASTDAIASVPGIDARFVGPADLGLRLAAAPPANGLTLADAIDRVSGAVRRHGKAWGIRAGSIEKLARRRGMDAQIVPRGGDYMPIQSLAYEAVSLTGCGYDHKSSSFLTDQTLLID